MALKFTCITCGVTLITEFLKVGETARCRNCGAPVVVPENALSTDEKSSLKVTSPEPLSNEFIKEDKVVFPYGNALKSAWKAVKANPDVSLGVWAIYIAIMVIVNIISTSIPHYFENKVIGYFIIYGASMVFFSFCWVGLLNISILLADDKKIRMSDFFVNVQIFWKYILGSIIYLLIVLFGLVLLIVPGIIFAIKYQFYDFFIVERNYGVIESFQKSAYLTQGFKGDLFGFDVAHLGFKLLGLLACCIGVIFTAPFSIAALAFVYRRLTENKGMKESVISEEPDETTDSVRQTTYPTIKQAIVLIVMMFLLAIFLTFPVRFILSFISHIATSLADSLPLEGLSVGEVSSIISIIAIIYYGFKRTGSGFSKVFPLKSFNYILLIPMTITIAGLTILLSEVDNLLRTILPMPESFVEIFTGFYESSLLGISSTIIFAPIIEEFLCRGLILRGFLANYSVKKAIWISALLFALMHLNPWQFTGAFVLGALFAWWYVNTGSLLPCLFGHVLANSLPLLFFYSISPDIQGFSIDYTANVRFQPWWFNLMGLVLTVSGMAMLFKMFNSNKQDVSHS